MVAAMFCSYAPHLIVNENAAPGPAVDKLEGVRHDRDHALHNRLIVGFTGGL
jgi:hypothetical protein